MNRLYRIVQRVEEFLLAWSMIAIAALMIGNVFCRAVLGFSLSFAEELSQFLIIGVTFVGLSYAAGRGRHIRMTALYDRFSRKWRKVLMMTISGFTALLMLALAWFSFEYIQSVRFLGSVSPVLRIPLFLVYLLFPLGFALAGLQYSLTVVRNFMSPDVYISFERKDEYEQPDTGEV